MIWIILAISVSACLCGNILMKIYTGKTVGGMVPVYAHSTCSTALAAIVILIWGGIGEISTFTFALAIVFGLLTSMQNFFVLMALQSGPISYTTVICSFSTLISALSGVFFFDESLRVTQIVGIVLMLVSFILAIEKDEGEKKASLRWLLFCMISFFLTGGIGIMQKVHQSSPNRGELNAFLVIAFAVAFVISAVFILTAKLRGGARILPENADKKSVLAVALCLILAGIFVGVNSKLNLYLSGVMDSAIFFPVVNGGGLVLTTVAAVVIFREKLSRKQWFGVVIGILSVLFLCI